MITLINTTKMPQDLRDFCHRNHIVQIILRAATTTTTTTTQFSVCLTYTNKHWVDRHMKKDMYGHIWRELMASFVQLPTPWGTVSSVLPAQASWCSLWQKRSFLHPSHVAAQSHPSTPACLSAGCPRDCTEWAYCFSVASQRAGQALGCYLTRNRRASGEVRKLTL